MLLYCSPVRMSGAASHICLLDRLISKAVRLSDGLVVGDLDHKRRVAALCMFNKIRCNPYHTLEAALPRVSGPARMTFLAISVYSRYHGVPRCHTVQFGELFVPACVQFWNSLDEPCFVGDGVAIFKSD